MESLNISNAIVATNINKLDTLQEIEDRIFTIRGVQVMIDRDLAEIYKVETKALNQAVKRNIERFPERYRFQLTKEEQQYYDSSRSQIVTSKKGGNRYLSYAFTEQGVSMLASVLKSETAVQTSIKIIDAFVAMRQFMHKNAKLFVEIDNIKQHLIQTDVHLNENDKKIEHINSLLYRFFCKRCRKEMFCSDAN
ncbi:MAG: ORF6N domain-containing protein [Bacteroidales bacterium]|nr:ORF6N domain-containing protein [Bacteroidales bacterium]